MVASLLPGLLTYYPVDQFAVAPPLPGEPAVAGLHVEAWAPNKLRPGSPPFAAPRWHLPNEAEVRRSTTLTAQRTWSALLPRVRLHYGVGAQQASPGQPAVCQAALGPGQQGWGAPEHHPDSAKPGRLCFLGYGVTTVWAPNKLRLGSPPFAKPRWTRPSNNNNNNYSLRFAGSVQAQPGLPGMGALGTACRGLHKGDMCSPGVRPRAPASRVDMTDKRHVQHVTQA